MNALKILLILVLVGRIEVSAADKAGWKISIIPSSIRVDPVSNEIIEQKFHGIRDSVPKLNLLEKNWIYNGDQVSLYSARGEYISFQLIISNSTDSPLHGISVDMTTFKNEDSHFKIPPELFLEWAVQVKTPSTGYPRASLGKGWYPDALIPLKYIQSDSSKVKGRWVYPFNLPDFNNRIDGQRSIIVWVDQYIPFDYKDAEPGTYLSTISVTIGDIIQKIPVCLNIWNFSLPNENVFKASLQQEGFLSSMDEEQELAVYQLFKRNRVSLMDPTYKPDLDISKSGVININWNSFDNRLEKYLKGDAFTKTYNYNYGPGYGEPIETFALPFDVYGKHGTAGWPDVGMPDVERNSVNRAIYTKVIQKVHDHLQPLINPQKTDLTVYLNGLDESYFPEAWNRMVYYGDIFKKKYPEAQFRVDGAYSEEAMSIIGKSINAWASHTINYNIDKVKKYQAMGIKDWLYGPMLYESKVNSWVGSSTFIDLPLINDRAISWSCWKYRTYSWLSWGIGVGWESGWYDPESWKDFFKEESESDSEFTYRKFNGNGSLIYKPGVLPNVKEPCPSIRLKTMRNGVQEYEYMRILAKLDQNSDRVDQIVNDIIKQPFGDKSIGNLDVWSYDSERWDQNRIKLGKLIDQFTRKKQ